MLHPPLSDDDAAAEEKRNCRNFSLMFYRFATLSLAGWLLIVDIALRRRSSVWMGYSPYKARLDRRGSQIVHLSVLHHPSCLRASVDGKSKRKSVARLI